VGAGKAIDVVDISLAVDEVWFKEIYAVSRATAQTFSGVLGALK